MSTAIAAPKQLKEYLVQLEKNDTMRSVISKAVTPERITGLILGEATKNPKIYEAVKSPVGQASVASFFMLAAQLGLEPGSQMGLIYPTPRRNKNDMTILPIVGYKGLCELARRSGKIRRINANPFYKEELEKGLIKISKEPPDVIHQWSPDVGMADDDLVGAYAVVEMTDGSKSTLVFSRAQIIERAKRGQSFDSDYSPWRTDFPAMCRKTVLRALMNGGTVPLTKELRTAIAEDADAPGRVIDAESSTISSTATVVKSSGADKLMEALSVNSETIDDDGQSEADAALES